MFSWAKELLNPSVQTGKPVGSDERRKSKASEHEGEITEEGFVCVGKSSFYKSPEMPALAHNFAINPPANPPMPMHNYNYNSGAPGGGPGVSTLYPVLPYPPPSTQMGVGDDSSDLVRRVPFRLRSGLTVGVGGESAYRKQKPHEVYLSRFRERQNYEYDFNFERGVLRELSQHSPGCY